LPDFECINAYKEKQAMAKKIYALLVGINDYAPEVGKLAGCLNDVDHFQAFLTGAFNKADLAIEVLKDSEATRDNIIKQFRGHLGKAKADDVVVFQYCGHGARWAAAKEFKEFYPDGKDEGLVCYDSRRQGGAYPFDLADKELAVLISEVAAKNPHLAVILDCCHSGSGTRDVDALNNLKPRQTHEVFAERPLDSYLDGYYAKLKKKGGEQWFSIPTSKHILLAACERRQKAMEAPDCSGVFTSTLVEVLDKTKGDISYADLFKSCRVAVRKRADNQNPQFEAYQRFNAYAGFLGRETSTKPHPYKVIFEGNSWKVDAGALQGLPTEPEKSAGLVLYREDGKLAGNASTTVVGPHKSDLQLDFTGDEAVSYKAEITSLPVAPIPVYFKGDDKSKDILQKELEKDRAVNVIFTDGAAGTPYALSAEDGKFLLKQQELDLLIQGVEVNAQNPEPAAKAMLSILKQVARWEKSFALQNHSTKMDTSQVDFVFAEQLDGGKEEVYPAGEIVLNFAKSGKDWKEIHGKFKVRNRTQQELHMALFYFSTSYGIHMLRNDPIVPGDNYVTLWGEDPNDYFYLDKEDLNESIENFKLIVSTEKVDDFLLSQEDLELDKIISGTRAIGSVKPMKKLTHENEWFTKHIRVKVVRQLDQVSAKGASLAKGKIVVKGNPAIKANVSLSAAKSATRSVGDGSDFYKALERNGMEMLNFAGTRGDNESILEFDIENAEALKDNPLEVELNVRLKDDEGILPLVFDGQYVLLGGDTFKDEQGNTHISIDHIPELPPENRRSLGKALKLYFFKTYLKREDVNLLRWVEFKADGTFERQKSNIANKMAAAQNILLLIHGIIGDTEVMAKGLGLAGLNQKFDLVLTYDYENLSTPIAETAEKLKQELASNGLGENDNKKLTLLVHSMGGLVARCFIEQKGGNKIVDHLVMCGTPNNGSPFGKIETARKLINILTPLAMTTVPMVVPFASTLLFRLKKITPTLEEMNPSSEFIKALNASGDPGVRYTILAGDINEYKDPAERSFLQNFLAKVGKGFVFDLLFGAQAHDIAVSVQSILGIDGSRNPVPTRQNVACHHLNYFVSEAGQKALAGVEW
jgi:pimeloyl-ACP methyl ester carboxylesterase